MLWLSLKWIRGGWDGYRIFLSGARSVCVRPPARAVSEAASPAPNISTAICLCPHPFISASASSSVLASDSPSCSIRFSSPFYSGTLFSTGAPPQRRFFSSPPTFQQLEADCTIISHLFWMFNSSVCDSCQVKDPWCQMQSTRSLGVHRQWTFWFLSTCFFSHSVRLQAFPPVTFQAGNAVVLLVMATALPFKLW